MHFSTALGLATALLSSTTTAINLQKRTDGPPRVIGFPIQRKNVENPVLRDRIRRRSDNGTVTASLENEETLYFANATLGTPAQSLKLHLDTGSSDLWVNTPSSALCSEKTKPCSAAGTYTANDSSTYEYVNSAFNISYVDGSGAAGDYVTDTLVLGGATLTQQQFGIGYSSSSDEGILGIGYEILEVQVGRAGLSAYANVPANLVAQGLINTNAYSLWLNDLDASTGSILFGGVDTEQYTGTLETLPIQKEYGDYYEFLITLTDVALGDTKLYSDQAVAVLLDSGSSLTYLPNDLTESIYQSVGAEYDSSEGIAYVPCSLATNSTPLEYTFGTPVISVTMDELVIPLTSSNGQPVTFTDGTEACLFGIAPGGSSTPVLGDTFIRSAYIVYDIANNEISLAQTKFNATTSNVVEITSGASGVPGASVIANAPTATSGVDSGTVTSTNGLKSSAGIAALPTPKPLVAAGAALFGMGVVYAAM